MGYTALKISIEKNSVFLFLGIVNGELPEACFIRLIPFNMPAIFISPVHQALMYCSVICHINIKIYIFPGNLSRVVKQS